MTGPEPVQAWKGSWWGLLRGEYAARLGGPGWKEVDQVRGTGAAFPGSTGASSAEAFGRAVNLVDQRLGSGDGSVALEFGHMAAQRWGEAFENLVTQLRGRPEKLLEILARDVYPCEVGEPGVPTSFRGDEDGAVVRLGGGPCESLERGLLEGFVRLGGATPTVVRQADGSWNVTWRLGPATQRTSRWAQAAVTFRPPFLAATVLPVFVALAIAAQDGPFGPTWATLTLVGVVCFQIATNLVNDHYDHRGAAHDPSRVGLLRPSHLRPASTVLYGLGTMIGLVLVAFRGIEVLWLGLAGFLLGFLYSAPPVRLAHRGLGELAVAIGFGPLIVLGTYYVQRQAWSMEAFFASLPLAFLMAAVLYIHEFPDKLGDARVGKRTLIVRLPERPAVVVYFVLLALAYVVILGGVALRGLPAYSHYAFPAWSLLGLLTLPLAIQASILLARNYRFPYRLVPANAFTILLHLTTGLLFGAGYLIALIA